MACRARPRSRVRGRNVEEVEYLVRIVHPDLSVARYAVDRVVDLWRADCVSFTGKAMLQKMEHGCWGARLIWVHIFGSPCRTFLHRQYSLLVDANVGRKHGSILISVSFVPGGQLGNN